MAKARKAKDGVNKSEKIRTFIAANKKAKGPAIVAAFAKKGINVSLSLVYAQLAKAGGPRHRKTTRAANTARGRKTSTGAGVSLEMLIATKRLASTLKLLARPEGTAQ